MDPNKRLHAHLTLSISNSHWQNSDNVTEGEVDYQPNFFVVFLVEKIERKAGYQTRTRVFLALA